MAGLPLPWKMHGQDLSPMLADPGVESNDPLLMVYSGQLYGSDTETIPTDPKVLAPAGVPWWASLIVGRYKYIRTLIPGEVEELYDLSDDPEELVNLARDAQHGSRVIEMRSQLIAELEKRDAGMARNLPPVASLPGEN
jgi:hypothetical protein